MRTVLILFFVTAYLSSLSQSFSITDSIGQPVSFATIEVPKKKVALFADVNGFIKLSSLDISDTDTLIISSIGFNTLLVPVNKIASKVMLARQVMQLPEVFAYNGKWKKENWGSLKNPRFLLGGFGCSWRLEGPGGQIGRVIKRVNGIQKPGWIYKIVFYTTHAEDSRSPVRLRVYSINKRGLPGNDLLMKTMVEKIDKKSGWLKFDLSDNEIMIPEDGLIVAAEYFDTDIGNWNSRKIILSDSTGKKRKIVDKWYGGSFATDNETNQGVTLMRYKGQWFKSMTNGIHPECENLVVQVWVRTPE